MNLQCNFSISCFKLQLTWYNKCLDDVLRKEQQQQQ